MKRPKKNPFWKSKPKNIIVAILIVLGSIALLHKLTDLTRNIHTISYSTFLDKIEQNQVKYVTVTGQDVEGMLKDGTRFETVVGNNPKDWDALRRHGVEFSVASPSNQLNLWYLFPFLCLLVMAWAMWYFFSSIT